MEVSSYIYVFPEYVRKHWLLFAIGGYIFFAALLKVFTQIDIGIPCLYTRIFGVHCPACGMTRAVMSLLRLDVKAAWDFNPLVFIILPMIIIVFGNDYRKFTRLRMQ